MPRPDISDKLIHFTSPRNDLNAACSRLAAILESRSMRASGGLIRGGHACVCFTEAPLTSLAGGLVNPSNFSRYAPFGIMLDKAWLFSKGGRPVIYQRDGEYGALPADSRWRHVKYEPDLTPPFDFSWEREWRIQGDLAFRPNEVAIVVPTQEWADSLRDYHDWQQGMDIEMYSMVMDQEIAAQYREDFPWRVRILSEEQA